MIEFSVYWKKIQSKRKASVLTCIIIVPTHYDYSHIFSQTGLLYLTIQFSFHLMNQHC